ncbi:hypothetical protein [Shewanella sp. UCD-KL12]|uniref:hypothetical protein n=1 Tax=Shewanella sp. UCD-KL12 TaxID=1917163 RepID=UPI0015C3AA48|nr:hypothetical protein [Shewanella sp. UCD-KL12]
MVINLQNQGPNVGSCHVDITSSAAEGHPLYALPHLYSYLAPELDSIITPLLS